jgi:hypothetical protein
LHDPTPRAYRLHDPTGQDRAHRQDPFRPKIRLLRLSSRAIAVDCGADSDRETAVSVAVLAARSSPSGTTSSHVAMISPTAAGVCFENSIGRRRPGSPLLIQLEREDDRPGRICPAIHPLWSAPPETLSSRAPRPIYGKTR